MTKNKLPIKVANTIANIPEDLRSYVRTSRTDIYKYIGFDELSSNQPLSFMIILGQYLVHIRDTCAFEKSWKFWKFLKDTFTIDIKYCDHAINLVAGSLSNVTIPNEALMRPYDDFLTLLKKDKDEKLHDEIKEASSTFYTRTTMPTKELILLVFEHILTLPGSLTIPRIINELDKDRPESTKYSHIKSTFIYLEKLGAIRNEGETIDSIPPGGRKQQVWVRTRKFDFIVSTTIEQIKELPEKKTLGIPDSKGKHRERISVESKVALFAAIHEHLPAETFTRKDISGIASYLPMTETSVLTVLSPLSKNGYFDTSKNGRIVVYRKTELFYATIGVETAEDPDLDDIDLDEEVDETDIYDDDDDSPISYEDIGIALERRLIYLSNRCKQLEEDSELCKHQEKHILELQRKHAELAQELESKKSSDFGDLKKQLITANNRITELEGINSNLCRDNDSLKVQLLNAKEETTKAQDLSDKLKAELDSRNARSKRKKKKQSTIRLKSLGDLGKVYS